MEKSKSWIEKYLCYNESEDKFYWKSRQRKEDRTANLFNSMYEGKEAGSIQDGVFGITINKEFYSKEELLRDFKGDDDGR